ncbi:hypothetical protein FDP41_013262 [Naegleria fowleri]|uniref:N-acetyltransferase domain-containing protein n=1 Tax=Naegleria fowleri TaxID=5763 RepID=A0A6A5C632_NAEFO|nr:uncharacterized protein FDP41_013262 [Naegleria fowleri]KAF0980779.1 hypothetical protein FDP41_013262 [Naegleria fowleri]
MKQHPNQYSSPPPPHHHHDVVEMNCSVCSSASQGTSATSSIGNKDTILNNHNNNNNNDTTNRNQKIRNYEKVMTVKKENSTVIPMILESFFEFTNCHSRLVHMELFASECSSSSRSSILPISTTSITIDFSLYKEIYSAYALEYKERVATSRKSFMINGTPQFYYTKIDMAKTDLDSMQEYSLLNSTCMHERLQFGSAYLYFPFIEPNVKMEIEELQRFKENCCEKIKNYLLKCMKIPREAYVGVTMQKAMLVEKQQLSFYFYEKKRFMREYLNCDFEQTKLYGSNFYHLNTLNPNAMTTDEIFELVEISSAEEYSQFWTCQSDAFCGVPQISQPLTNIIEQSYTQEISKHNDAVIVGVKAYCPSTNRFEIVSCGELVMGKECASINHVATREGHRNKGYATFIMIALLDIAMHRHGYNKVVLEATGMGIQIYGRLGFVPFFEYYIFELDHKN